MQCKAVLYFYVSKWVREEYFYYIAIINNKKFYTSGMVVLVRLSWLKYVTLRKPRRHAEFISATHRKVYYSKVCYMHVAHQAYVNIMWGAETSSA